MSMLTTPSRRGGRRGIPLPDVSDAWVSAEDWSSISLGSTVEVVNAAHYSYVGRVDAKRPESSIVWVVSTTGQCRQMYGHRGGIRLRTVAEGMA
ncbi:hypothetical protein NicSoilB8_24230 [Arthrobacter sp. NicSoilB8]|jgi:hypothetical protein|nr:hypothetical protein NicSoilB8_24230 [Arthrobacter sp. NicSoilB8]